MGVADIDVRAVDGAVAIEDDPVAEPLAQAELMGRRADHHELAQGIDEWLQRRRGQGHHLDHRCHDVTHRQEGLALIELAACVEGTDQRLALGPTRIGNERIERAIEHLEAQHLVGRTDDARKRGGKL
jgi:hypothetical protein